MSPGQYSNCYIMFLFLFVITLKFITFICYYSLKFIFIHFVIPLV